MAIYVLPFVETNQGWYEIEAETIEQAKAIVISGDFLETAEPYYRKGDTTWDENDLTEEN